VPDGAPWLATAGDGCELLVHVRPGVAREPGVSGLHGTALCVRVRARPVEGAANDEVLQVLAKALRVPRRALTVRRGARSRTKRIAVSDLSAATIRARLAPFLD